MLESRQPNSSLCVCLLVKWGCSEIMERISVGFYGQNQDVVLDKALTGLVQSGIWDVLQWDALSLAPALPSCLSALTVSAWLRGWFYLFYQLRACALTYELGLIVQNVGKICRVNLNRMWGHFGVHSWAVLCKWKRLKVLKTSEEMEINLYSN